MDIRLINNGFLCSKIITIWQVRVLSLTNSLNAGKPMFSLCKVCLKLDVEKLWVVRWRQPSRFFFSNPPSRSEGKEIHLFCCRKYGRAVSVISVKIRKSNGGMMRGMR